MTARAAARAGSCVSRSISTRSNLSGSALTAARSAAPKAILSSVPILNLQTWEPGGQHGPLIQRYAGAAMDHQRHVRHPPRSPGFVPRRARLRVPAEGGRCRPTPPSRRSRFHARSGRPRPGRSRPSPPRRNSRRSRSRPRTRRRRDARYPRSRRFPRCSVPAVCANRQT